MGTVCISVPARVLQILVKILYIFKDKKHYCVAYSVVGVEAIMTSIITS